MRQQPLFPAADQPAEVPGLAVHRDYVDLAEQQRLIGHVDAGEWSDDYRRRVQLYGVSYGDEGVAWARDFPPWLDELGARLVRAGHLPRMPDNCVINSYAPGVGIGPHRDYMVFDAPLVALSLLSDVVVDFSDGARSVPVDVPARSLWRASGEARWRWTHGIAARRSDTVDGQRRPRGRRVSLTFRVARGPARRPG